MPLYEYQCRECGKAVEIRHGFDETVAVPCAHCGGALARLFNAAGIVFKGSGFYKTDSRKAPAAEKPESAPSDSAKADSAKTDGAKSEAPAKAPAPASEASKSESGKNDATPAVKPKSDSGGASAA